MGASRSGTGHVGRRSRTKPAPVALTASPRVERGAEAPHSGYSNADIWAVAACLSTELAGCSTVRS
jgi:hypothetical protein